MDGLYVSLDLETLDTRQSSVVVAVGAVFFTKDKVFTKYPLYRQLQLEPQFAKGRTISEKTLCWWMDQCDEARASTFQGKQKVHPKVMFEVLFGQWSERWGVRADADFPDAEQKILGWYTNGPSFDTAILEHMANQFAVPMPHRYGDPRDMRGWRDVLPKNLHPPREGTYHNALDDAIYQARLIQAAWAYMDRYRPDAKRWERLMLPFVRQEVIDFASKDSRWVLDGEAYRETGAELYTADIRIGEHVGAIQIHGDTPQIAEGRRDVILQTLSALQDIRESPAPHALGQTMGDTGGITTKVGE